MRGEGREGAEREIRNFPHWVYMNLYGRDVDGSQMLGWKGVVVGSLETFSMWERGVGVIQAQKIIRKRSTGE